MINTLRKTLEAQEKTQDQYIAGSTVGTTGRVRSGQFSVRSVAVSREFDPNGYFLSGAYKYNPNRAFDSSGAEETYQGC